MDYFDTERDLEDAGISAFEYSLMDEHERREVLEDAGLDSDLYIDADQFASFSAWEELQDAGLSLSDLDSMDNDAIREILADAGLDPSEYGCENGARAASPAAVYPIGVAEPHSSDAFPVKPSGPSEKPNPSQSPLDSESQGVYQLCMVRFSDGNSGFYRTSDRTIAECDYVAVPVDKSTIQIAMVVAVGRSAEAELNYPEKDLGFILRKAQPHEFTALRTPYHGAAAAQVTCKNCGYHSDNGLNSLCDYCAWMERYGGGLPTAKLITPRPASTPRRVTSATPKPTAKPDPFHAEKFYDAEDFYEEYYDDFWDYEDAEDYWEEHQFD